MPVDRIFTVRGTGTVVTGTVWSGALQQDATVRIEPAGATARVRALQRHGEDTDRVCAGERAAVALAGFDRHSLSRGDVLVTGTAWRPASMLTVELVVLGNAAELVTRQRVRVHLGTAEVFGRLVLADRTLQPGDTGLAQLRLESPVVARAGDRFVIRSYSPVRTIAGGVVLEPDAPKRKKFPPEIVSLLHGLGGAVPDRLGALLALAGAAGVRRDHLPLLTGVRPAEADALVAGYGRAVVIEDRVVDSIHVEDCTSAALSGLEAYHAAEPLEAGLDREALLRRTGAERSLFNAVVSGLTERGQVVQAAAGALALASHRPTPSAPQRSALDSISGTLEAAGLEPPDVATLPGGADGALPLLRYLESQRMVVRLPDGRWAAARAVADAATRLRRALPADVDLPLGDFKDVLGLTRKHLLPLLEYLDGVGVCVRRGESRSIVPETITEVGPGTRQPADQLETT
jgi:selenocysteine-specific elongation factor